MEVAEGVYKIPGEGSVYLILDPVLTLVDTGDSDEWSCIKSEIERVVPIDKIERVILTHLHYDHTGNVDKFPNAKFYAGAEEIEDYKKDSYQFFFGDVPESIDKVLKNGIEPLGDEISGMRVLKVPGHTRGGIALLDEKRKLLFSGDTLFRASTGRVDLPNSVPGVMDGSVAKLRKYLGDGFRLMPGHDY